MDIKVQKIELIRMILGIEDETLIRRMKALMMEETPDWWDELPEKVKSNVFRAEKEIHATPGIPHEEVKKKYAHWLKR